MNWEWYQSKIAQMFRRVKNARVKENVSVKAKSGKRKLDVQIFLPMKIELSDERMNPIWKARNPEYVPRAACFIAVDISLNARSSRSSNSVRESSK